SPKVPIIATAGLETIGVRMPRFELARQFLKYCGVPVVAPSANLSGRPSPTTWEAVYEDLNGRIDCILQGEPTEIGLESTVVDCTGRIPVLLRKGSISLEELREVIPETSVVEAEADISARSPGLRHKHYSPRAEVRSFSAGDEIESRRATAFIGLKKPAAPFVISMICKNVEEYAKNLFAFFRECDSKGVEVVYCENVPETGIGAALMDRLQRAAE
ncbi:MAG: L-threonylcarbamoyladenylate synthase, partial [Pyrinomonadaceae bacterium]